MHFFYSHCDGKPCFKEQNTCDKNTNGLCDVCNGTCLDIHNNYNYTLVHSIDECSVSYFTFKNIPYYFKDCPKYTKCDWHSVHGIGELKCKGVFYL